MSHEHDHDHSKTPHNDHGGTHKIPPLHKPEVLITDSDQEDTVHERAPLNIWQMTTIGLALVVALLVIAFAVLSSKFEAYRLAGIGHPDPGDRYTPDWLKAETVDEHGKPRYPELKAKLAKEAEAKRTGKKLAMTSAPTADAGTGGSSAPADEDGHEEKPATTAPVTATKQSAAQLAVADDGLTYLVATNDTLIGIGQKMSPRFCGIIGGNQKENADRREMFIKKVMEANQSPIAKGFQALPTPTALRAGFKIKLPAECKKEPSTDPKPTR